MKKLRVAIIGAGQIAQGQHIPNYRAMPEVELVGICDRNAAAAAAAAELGGIPYTTTDAAALLAETNPDAVSVCVPNKFHCENVLACLRAGCHVLCEKPPAITMAEARQMAQTAAANHLLLSYGFHFRHSPAVAALHSRVQKGELGPIRAAQAQWLRRRGVPGWGCFTDKGMQGGGPLIDIGAHVLDLALYLMDYPAVRYACATASDAIGKQGGVGSLGAWDGARYTVEDSLLGKVVFENGAGLDISAAFAINIPEENLRSVRLYGDNLGAELFPLGYFGADGPCLPDAPAQKSNLYRREVENFVHACLGQEELLVTAEQGCRVQEIIEGLYLSADTRLPAILTPVGWKTAQL